MDSHFECSEFFLKLASASSCDSCQVLCAPARVRVGRGRVAFESPAFISSGVEPGRGSLRPHTT